MDLNIKIWRTSFIKYSSESKKILRIQRVVCAKKSSLKPRESLLHSSEPLERYQETFLGHLSPPQKIAPIWLRSSGAARDIGSKIQRWRKVQYLVRMCNFDWVSINNISPVPTSVCLQTTHPWRLLLSKSEHNLFTFASIFSLLRVVRL